MNLGRGSLQPKRVAKLPKRFDDTIVYINCANVLNPSTFKEAVSGVDAAQW